MNTSWVISTSRRARQVEFFTPRTVVRYMVEVLRTRKERFWIQPVVAEVCLYGQPII